MVLRRVLSFLLCCPLVACALIVWLTLVLSVIFAKSLEATRHFHTDQIFTRRDLVSLVSTILIVGCF